MNQLEEQLRSWMPRRPSAGVERWLFGAAAAPGLRVLLRVLAPVGASLILTVGRLNPAGHDNSAELGQVALLSGSLSNQSYSAYLSGSFTCDANRLATFRWTNGGGFPSSTFSISPRKAND